MSLIQLAIILTLFTLITLNKATKADCRDYANPLNEWLFQNCELTNRYDQDLGLPEGTQIMYRLGAERDSFISSFFEFPSGTTEVNVSISCQVSYSQRFWLVLQLGDWSQEIADLSICEGQWGTVNRTFTTSPGKHVFALIINSVTNVDQDWLAIDSVMAIACPPDLEEPIMSFWGALAIALALAALITTFVYMIRYWRKVRRARMNPYVTTDEDLGL